MRTIGVVTAARSDYGIFRPILERIRRDKNLALKLFVAGGHLSRTFGRTENEILKDGFRVAARVKTLPKDDTPLSVARAMGSGVAGFATAFDIVRPDILLVLGDRFEMHSAAAAALPLLIPVGHIHGGESTEGSLDQCFRHSITKMSHLHFVASRNFRERVIRMGEEPWRITVSGAPSLDNILAIRFLSFKELERTIGVSWTVPPLLVTFHPDTLQPSNSSRQLLSLLSALDVLRWPVVITSPGADAGGRKVWEKVHQFSLRRPWATCVKSLGNQTYFSLMRHARAMVGNSSSGIIESTSFELPVVDVGDRQKGRPRSRNVINVPADKFAILKALRRAGSPLFQSKLKGLKNPYGDGHASERIVQTLKSVRLDRKLLVKTFYDGESKGNRRSMKGGL
jgi:UDP-N-acetylglucosamine 2-epimerase (non-hydrolysing)